MTNKGNSSATLLFVFVALSVAVAGYFTGLQAPMKASSVESPLLVAADKVTHTTEAGVVPATHYKDMAAITKAQPEAVAPTDHAMGESPNGLQPISHPENHDGMDLAELPPMREAMLTEEQVHQLFSDIEALGSDILLMQRSARSPRASAAKATTTEQLRTAQDSLLTDSVPRVQIRYHWEAANWIDTLERKDDGVRLVRITYNKANNA